MHRFFSLFSYGNSLFLPTKKSRPNDTSVNIIKELIYMSDDNDKYTYEYTMAEMYLDLYQYDSDLYYAKESFLHGNKYTN